MVREIITPKAREYTINIPQEYLGKKVEVFVVPISDTIKNATPQTSDIIHQTAGILNLSVNDPIAWQNAIRKEWNR